MILNNMKKLMKYSGSKIPFPPMEYYKDPSGNNVSVNGFVFNRWVLLTDDNTAEPSVDDYHVGGGTIDTYSMSDSESIINDTTCQFTFTLTNDKGADYTLRRYGLAAQDANAGYNIVLLTLDKMETPVVIPDGTTKTLTLTIDLGNL